MPELSVEQQLSPKVKAAVIDLLYRLADDHLVLGHRNSEWTGLAPILEADIALSSMAQDKMGHALAYYRLLEGLGEPDPDSLAFLRSVDQFRCCSLVALERGDWALSMARHFLFDHSSSVRLAALSQSSYAPMAAVARKLKGEVKYHVMHARMSITKLGRGTDESHARVQGALDRLFPHALGIFEPTAGDETLAADGVQPREAALCDTWLTEIEAVVAESGLRLPVDAKPVYGGRFGNHPDVLARLIDDMQQVYRLEPDGDW